MISANGFVVIILVMYQFFQRLNSTSEQYCALPFVFWSPEKSVLSLWSLLKAQEKMHWLSSILRPLKKNEKLSLNSSSIRFLLPLNIVPCFFSAFLLHLGSLEICAAMHHQFFHTLIARTNFAKHTHSQNQGHWWCWQ